MMLLRSRMMLRLASVLAITCFFSALAFPAVGTCAGNPADQTVNWFDNTNVFIFGWLGPVAGQFGWYTNVPFAGIVMTFLFGKRPNDALIISQAALLLVAMLTLSPVFGMKLPHNEGFSEPVCFLGAGFWIWVTANVIALVAAIWVRSRGRSEH